jgi:hypothetical protein
MSSKNSLMRILLLNTWVLILANKSFILTDEISGGETTTSLYLFSNSGSISLSTILAKNSIEKFKF